MRTTMPPPGNAVTVTPRSRRSSSCSTEVACCRDDSRVFIVVAVAGGSAGEGAGSGTPGYERWHARAGPMMAPGGRMRIGYQFIGTPLLPHYAELTDRSPMVRCRRDEDRNRDTRPLR